MLIFLLAYIGGILTIFSPCVLPVLPFIFARSEQSFKSSGLPILIGMALTFTLLASFAAVGGAWLVQVNQYGRYAAMVLLLLFGIALIFPVVSNRLMRPLVALGERLQQRADADQQNKVKSSLLLGVAVGFLWAPCAGPILGLVLAGAALQGANLYSALLLLTFAASAATSLSMALLAGKRVYTLMKRNLSAEEWLRRILGIAVVVGVVAIALGWDTRFLSQFSFLNTAKIEQKLIEGANQSAQPSFAMQSAARQAPTLPEANHWINSTPLSNESLRGKVILVDFWTYSCINCLRTLPYLKAWDEKYRKQGLIIIGVHTPEFAFEKEIRNVEQATRELGIHYPVAIDNQYAIWKAYQNRYWPAHYLIDAQGRIRHQHFGEGAYQETEQMIQTLLKETHQDLTFNNELVNVKGVGTTAATSTKRQQQSPETYLGYARQKNMASPEALQQNTSAKYSAPTTLALHHWALQGNWKISSESATSQSAGGAIAYRFQGRDLHLVLGSHNDKLNKPIRFKVTLDGKVPGTNHGTDIDAQGYGEIKGQRLYQLVRQKSNPSTDTKTKTGTENQHHLFNIEFLDPGAEAFAFTFG